MIRCSRCLHLNHDTLTTCELCGAPLKASADVPAQLLHESDDEEILSVDDLEPVEFEVEPSLLMEVEAHSERPPHDAVDLNDLPTSGYQMTEQGDRSGEDLPLARNINDPSSQVQVGSPAGLARLLHDALSSTDDGSDNISPSNARPTPSPASLAPSIDAPSPSAAADSISDQELSAFLLDALSEQDTPASAEVNLPKNVDSAGLFNKPYHVEPAVTLETPGHTNTSEHHHAERTEQATSAVGIQCANCGGYNPEGMFYCVYCGFSLGNDSNLPNAAQDDHSLKQSDAPSAAEPRAQSQHEVVCPSCHAINPAGNRFCGSCGFSLADAGHSHHASSGSLNAAPKRHASPWDVRLVSINEDGTDGLEIPLEYLKTVVGRTGDTRFPTDAFLSPKHACLTIERGALFIEDLYSLNGSFVKLRHEVSLSPGDVFLMGRQVLRFEKFEQTITPKARSSDGTRYMGSPPPGGMFKLLQVGIGGVVQNVYCISESGAVLGREKGDIVFPSDKFMSGRHAQLYPREDGTYCLVDLNSSNGTWVKIWEKTQLNNGDFVFMGQQLFRVELNDLV